MRPISLKEKFAPFSERWAPKIASPNSTGNTSRSPRVEDAFGLFEPAGTRNTDNAPKSACTVEAPERL